MCFLVGISVKSAAVVILAIWLCLQEDARLAQEGNASIDSFIFQSIFNGCYWLLTVAWLLPSNDTAKEIHTRGSYVVTYCGTIHCTVLYSTVQSVMLSQVG